MKQIIKYLQSIKWIQRLGEWNYQRRLDKRRRAYVELMMKRTREKTA